MNEDYELVEFDTIRMKEFIEKETNTSIVTYLITIILYIISFYYLFEKKGSTEYMIWILVFILHTVTPVLWMSDMFKLYDTVQNKIPGFNKQIFSYGFFCLVVSSLLGFIALFMVILKNEEVRKAKKKQGHYQNGMSPDIKTDIHVVEKKDRVISIIYTTMVTIIWGMIAFNFGEYLVNTDQERSLFPFGSRIKALIDIVPVMLTFIDQTIHYYAKQIAIPSIVKSMLVYIIAFVAIFFGIFAKMKYRSTHSGAGMFGTIEIVNMIPLFSSRFENEFVQIRHFVIFLVAFLSTMMFGELFQVSNYLSIMPTFPDTLMYFMMTIFAAVIFPLLFMKEKEWFPKNRIKEIIFFFLCVVFGIVAAAPLTGIVEMVLSLVRTSSSGIPVFLGSYAKYLYFIIFALLAAILYTVGMVQNWIGRNGREMKMFLTLLVTMTISLFFGLSTEFSVFKNVYDIIGFILRITMKFIAPIVLLVLSLIITVFSHDNFQKIKKASVDTIAKKKAQQEESPEEVDPIRDQKKLRNRINNFVDDVNQTLKIKDKVNLFKDAAKFLF